MGMQTPTSPFAPKRQPEMPEIAGVKFAVLRTGAREMDRPDLLLVAFDSGATAAGVYTRSKTRSAAVEWSAKQTGHGFAQALVVNSGNANAFTGLRGENAVKNTAQATADALGCKPEHVFIASTGVIGEPLDTSKFATHLKTLSKALHPTGWVEAANAIMTTDTYPKMATATTQIDGVPVKISGIAKGSGMIAPDMATMLAFLFTDATIEPGILQTLLSGHTKTTFNAITVDGDTSTSDTLIAFATGKAMAPQGSPIQEAQDPRLSEFSNALHGVMHDLALQIVKDGEGLTKLVSVTVTGAQTDEAARTIAFSIANSPLVKTAIAGEDANWGRVVMAVGKAGEQANRDKLAIWFGPHQVASNGERAHDYDESITSAYMKNKKIEIRVDVGIAKGAATIWTCDLTHGYININADYRT